MAVIRVIVVVLLGVSAVMTNGQRVGKKPIIGEDCSVDILFVLDASGSVRGDFTNMRDFVADIAETLTVSATGHRVSLLEYSGPSLVWRRYPFGFAGGTQEFVEFIRKLPFLQGTTSTGRALTIAREMLEERRRDVITLVIVVTDGYSFDDVIEQADAIRASENVILFAAGVTEFLNVETLLRISGDDGHLWTNPDVLNRAERSLHEYLTCIIRPKRVPAVSSTKSTTAIARSTTTRVVTTQTTRVTTTSALPTTTTPVTGCEMDLIFVIDFSSSVSSLYQSYVDMAVKAVEQLHTGEYYTRVAMIQYSSSARTYTTFHLNEYKLKENVIAAMRRAEFSGGTTNTSAGLEQAAQELNPSYGARPKKARQVVVVITDGFSQTDPTPSALRLRQTTGVTLYAVSAAESEAGADVGQLIAIAGDQSRVFMVHEYPNLVKILSSVSNRCKR